MLKQFMQFAIAATVITCSISNVTDPKTGKIGYLESCGKGNDRKAYVGGFMKSYKQATKVFKRYVTEHPDKPAYTVDYQELLKKHTN